MSRTSQVRAAAPCWLLLVAAACATADVPKDGGGGACERTSDCGNPAPGPWGECTYADPCAEDGEKTRDVTFYECHDRQCVSRIELESEVCTRTTEGTTCADDGTLCGEPMPCHVCRSGACVLNTPHYNAACQPSCGHAGDLCGVSVGCCAVGTTCLQGSPGNATYNDCQRCCINQCL